ncbi:hypothetical protein [Duganella radicis]|uniref:hypothetical protein n=1 Tax=Duganella radicis TaxID=551988 RepID=UPI00147856FB|nr:hypothetical protein [Duganella radicis]
MRLDDLLFSLHGIGPRYALVQNATVHGRQLSYAMLDLPGTAYDIITDHDAPHVPGTFQQLADAAGALRVTLDAAFKADRQTGGFASKQQMALALIRAAADHVDHLDQLAVLRTVRCAKRYELRADWLARHRAAAFMAASIDWRALGLS